jgi:hypothetical protein
MNRSEPEEKTKSFRAVIPGDLQGPTKAGIVEWPNNFRGLQDKPFWIFDKEQHRQELY